MVHLNASGGPIPCRNMMGLQKNGTCHEAIISHKILVGSIFGQTHIDRQIDTYIGNVFESNRQQIMEVA
jgi:hypothetical protein